MIQTLLTFLMTHLLGLVIIAMILNEVSLLLLFSYEINNVMLWISRALSAIAVLGRVLQENKPAVGQGFYWPSLWLFCGYAAIIIGIHLWFWWSEDWRKDEDGLRYSGQVFLQLVLIILLPYAMWA